MNMNQRKTILVTGATGAQGGSVARALLREGNYDVRCLTRNPESENAKALQHAGATIIKGDLDDITSLALAMEGVYGVFGVTNFWEHFDKEYQHGKNLILAVVAARVDHFILSTLPSAEKMSGGRFRIPHFDIKAALQQYARTIKPDTSFVHVGAYYENMLSFILPQPVGDGGFSWRLPQGNTKYASIAVEDLGPIVAAMFNHPDVYKKRTVGAVGTDMPFADYASVLSRVLQVPISYKHIPEQEFAALGFPGAAELAAMYAFNEAYITDRQMDLIESYGLNPSVQTFESWAIHNKENFLCLLAAQEKKAS
jgi:uncharacterized protein YbjT (DUF2867 family)